MELLVKICTWRNLFLAVAAMALFYPLRRLDLPRYPKRWYRDWRYPPQKGPSPAGDEIMRLAEKRDAAALVRRYERVMEQLGQAQNEGFEVSALQRKARVALGLNESRYRQQAVTLLADVEMKVPRKKVQYIPLYPTEDVEDEILEDVPGRRVEKRRR